MGLERHRRGRGDRLAQRPYLARGKKAEKSGDASYELLSDVGEAGCVRVTLEGLEPDSADAKAYLDSFVPNDEKTVKDDYQKACEIKFDEVVADFGK